MSFIGPLGKGSSQKWSQQQHPVDLLGSLWYNINRSDVSNTTWQQYKRMVQGGSVWHLASRGMTTSTGLRASQLLLVPPCLTELLLMSWFLRRPTTFHLLIAPSGGGVACPSCILVAPLQRSIVNALRSCLSAPDRRRFGLACFPGERRARRCCCFFSCPPSFFSICSGVLR